MKELITGGFIALFVFWNVNFVGQAVVVTKNFGPVKIFKKTSKQAQSYTLIFSDDHGWDHQLDAMATQIAESQVTVIGVDMAAVPHHFDESADRDAFASQVLKLASVVEKTLAEVSYVPPNIIFLRDRHGLALHLAQADEASQFNAIELIGNCPALTKGSRPRAAVEIFTDENNRSQEDCQALGRSEFKDQLKVHFVPDLVGTEKTVTKWTSEMKEIWQNRNRSLATALPFNLSTQHDDGTAQLQSMYPLIVLAPEKITSDHFVLLLSGDGGWSDFTERLAVEYVKKGIPVVGINSLLYFWHKKTPEEFHNDLETISSHYLQTYKMKKFDLVGYSFGASVVPLAVSRMSEAQKNRLRLAAMLAPGLNSKLEFEVTDWLTNADSGQPIENDLRLSLNIKFTCLHAQLDAPSICQSFDKKYGQAIILKGNHHFDYNFRQFDDILF